MLLILLVHVFNMFLVQSPTVKKTHTLPTNQNIVVQKKMSNTHDSACIDLAFDTVTVVQIAEKYIELEYSIINKGTAPAPIFGKKRTYRDNVAIHFFFSGTPRLTRGSVMVQGIFLTEGLRATKGMLAPGAIYKQRFKLSLEKKNQFYGVIILQLDAFDVLPQECDETNNVYSVVPKWY